MVENGASHWIIIIIIIIIICYNFIIYSIYSSSKKYFDI